MPAGGDHGHRGDRRVGGPDGWGRDRPVLGPPEEGSDAACRDRTPSGSFCRHLPIVIQRGADTIVRSAYLPTYRG